MVARTSIFRRSRSRRLTTQFYAALSQPPRRCALRISASPAAGIPGGDGRSEPQPPLGAAARALLGALLAGCTARCRRRLRRALCLWWPGCSQASETRLGPVSTDAAHMVHTLPPAPLAVAPVFLLGDKHLLLGLQAPDDLIHRLALARDVLHLEPRLVERGVQSVLGARPAHGR